MKKLSLLTVAVAATSLAVGATAAQADTYSQTLSAKFSSTKAGTTKKPKGINLTVTTGTVANPVSALAMPISNATITMPKGININYKAFPACKDATALNCPANTQLGTGTASAHIDNITYNPTGKLISYQGAGGTLLIRTMFTTPAIVDLPVPGTLTKSGGVNVLKFTVPAGSLLQTPLPGDNAQVLSFAPTFKNKTIKKNGKKVNYIETTSCPKGGWVFKGTFNYLDGSSSSTTSAPVKCS